MKSCLLSVFAMLFVASTLNAQLVWDGTSSPWTHGTGTETDPYLIETPQNLAWLSDMVNNGMTYSGVCFKQTADFNMNGIAFDPIGTSTTYCFSGHYDGGHKRISNLTISGLSDYAGLFGYTRNANMKRILIFNFIPNANSDKVYIGSISGCSNNDTITECGCDSCTIDGSNVNISQAYIGGMVGKADNLVISKCFVKGNISGDFHCTTVNKGGLIGYITDNVNIKSCYYIGIVSVSTCYVACTNVAGMIIGQVYGEGNSIENCYAIGAFMIPANASHYTIHDVMVGYCYYNPAIYPSLTYNNNSYCGTSLANSSDYASKRTDAYMKSQGCPSILNIGLSSPVYYFDYDSVNDGYPVFDYQLPVRYYTIIANYDESKGTVTGAGVYTNGTTATLRAMPAEGYLFSGWSDGSTENPRTVTVTGDATYSANFTKNAYNIYIKQDCTVEVE